MNKATRKELFRRLFASMHGQFRLFSPLIVNAHVVILEFAGVQEEFRLHESELHRMDNGYSLDPQDSQALYMLANDLHHACLLGYRHSIPIPFNYVPSDNLGEVSGRPRDKDLLAKARKTILYQEYRENYGSSLPRYLDVVKISAGEAEIRLANYYHRFIHFFRAAKYEDQGIRLSREYFTFLCVFAHYSMKAVFAGYNFERTNKTARKSRDLSYLRQLRLQL